MKRDGGLTQDRGGDGCDIGVPVLDACRPRAVERDVGVHEVDAAVALDHGAPDGVDDEVEDREVLPLGTRDQDGAALDDIVHHIVAVTAEPGIDRPNPAEAREVAARAAR